MTDATTVEASSSVASAILLPSATRGS